MLCILRSSSQRGGEAASECRVIKRARSADLRRRTCDSLLRPFLCCLWRFVGCAFGFLLRFVFLSRTVRSFLLLSILSDRELYSSIPLLCPTILSQNHDSPSPSYLSGSFLLRATRFAGVCDCSNCNYCRTLQEPRNGWGEKKKIGGLIYFS